MGRMVWYGIPGVAVLKMPGPSYLAGSTVSGLSGDTEAAAAVAAVVAAAAAAWLLDEKPSPGAATVAATLWLRPCGVLLQITPLAQYSAPSPLLLLLCLLAVVVAVTGELLPCCGLQVAVRKPLHSLLLLLPSVLMIPVPSGPAVLLHQRLAGLAGGADCRHWCV